MPSAGIAEGASFGECFINLIRVPRIADATNAIDFCLLLDEGARAREEPIDISRLLKNGISVDLVAALPSP